MQIRLYGCFFFFFVAKLRLVRALFFKCISVTRTFFHFPFWLGECTPLGTRSFTRGFVTWLSHVLHNRAFHLLARISFRWKENRCHCAIIFQITFSSQLKTLKFNVFNKKKYKWIITKQNGFFFFRTNSWKTKRKRILFLLGWLKNRRTGNWLALSQKLLQTTLHGPRLLGNLQRKRIHQVAHCSK